MSAQGPSKRERAARALDRSGLGALLRAAGAWRGVLVLTHHRIGDPAGCDVDRRSFSATEQMLDAQAALLARTCDTVAVADLARSGLDRPGRRVLLTFDDGYRDNYERALPILAAHGVPATFFLTTGFIDGVASPWWDEIAWMLRRSAAASVHLSPWLPDPVAIAAPNTERAIDALVTRYAQLRPAEGERYLEALAEQTGSGRRSLAAARADFMTWEMARELRDAGMTLGGHTVTHPVLTTVSATDQRAEIEAGLERIGEQLGARPEALAYPVGAAGAYDAATIEAAAASGVRWAFANHGGYARRGHAAPLDVPRLNLDLDLSAPGLRAILALPRLFAHA